LQNYTQEAELNRNLLPNADITGFLDPLLLTEDHPASIYYLESLSLLLFNQEPFRRRNISNS
uniref:hypothetical protein n=1 Tax=Leadbetterella sp. DM7 TaxID=3235085 RepID=UPI00349E9757